MFPGLKYIKVYLQYGRVLRCGDASVEKAVIREESDMCTWGQVFIYIINVGQVQKGAKDYALRDTG